MVIVVVVVVVVVSAIGVGVGMASRVQGSVPEGGLAVRG